MPSHVVTFLNLGGLLFALAACAVGEYAGRDDVAGVATGPGRSYALQAVYFDRKHFRTAADCLTEAYTRRLPPELCL
jgi:hypothetical protein